jgi:hypothetical protein
VYFTNVDPNNPVGAEVRIEVPSFTVENNRVDFKTTSMMEFTLPELPRNASGNFFGYFVIECAASKAVVRFQTLPEPIITSISSDMPIPGMKVTINGSFFIKVEYVEINGEITILPEDMEELTRTKITFTMPAKPSKSGELRIVASNGVGVRKNFYPYGQLLTDYDEVGKYENWGGISFEPDPENPAANLPAFSDGKFALMRATVRDTWWGPAIAMFKDTAAYKVESILPSFDYIPANTPSSEVYLAYECYNKYPFESSAFVRYEFLDAGIKGVAQYFNYDWGTNTVMDVCHPGYDGVPLYNQWYMALVPLSKFDGFADLTYGDIYKKGIAMLHFVVINPVSTKNTLDIMFDNVRFITLPK